MKNNGLNTNSVTLGFANGLTVSVSCPGGMVGEVPELADDLFADEPTCAPHPGSLAFRRMPPAEQKKCLLDHYSTREPHVFKQYDVFTNMHLADVMRPDDEGDAISGGDTHELMSGAWDVRCLINPRITQGDAVRALRKVLACIEREEWGDTPQ